MLKISALSLNLTVASILAIALMSMGGQASADVLEIMGGEPEAASSMAPAGPILPRRGSSKSQVEAEYGPPVTKHPAIGDPPITRWDYDGFSVFFEYQHVLHAVIPDQPKPIYNKDELQAGY